jgi:hypothetical protein
MFSGGREHGWLFQVAGIHEWLQLRVASPGEKLSNKATGRFTCAK